VGLLLLGLWQLAAVAKWPDPVLAKSPVQAWDYLVGAARTGELWSNTWATMTAVLIAWVLAGLAGIVAGLALGLMPRTERVLSPYLDAANAMPRIALAPLLIVALRVPAGSQRDTGRRMGRALPLLRRVVRAEAEGTVRSR
jgi:NitT/TauT family transport system permease protein